MRENSGKQSCWESARYPARGEPCCNTTAGHKFSPLAGKQQNEGGEGVTGSLEQQNSVSCLMPQYAAQDACRQIGEFREVSQE